MASPGFAGAIRPALAGVRALFVLDGEELPYGKPGLDPVFTARGR